MESLVILLAIIFGVILAFIINWITNVIPKIFSFLISFFKSAFEALTKKKDKRTPWQKEEGRLIECLLRAGCGGDAYILRAKNCGLTVDEYDSKLNS